MISSLTLKFTENEDLTLPALGITIFVGPNNSGKSLVLKEVEQCFLIDPFPADLHVVKDYEVIFPSEEELEAALAKFASFKLQNMSEGNVVVGRITPTGGLEVSQIDRNGLFEQAKRRSDKRWWATQFLKWGVVRLDGRSRFNLTNDQSGGDLLATPQNVLAHLFQDDDARTRVRAFIKEALGSPSSSTPPIWGL